MIYDLTINEQQVADVLAAEYRAKGYKVSREAPLEFLPGFRADLLVEKDDVVEVVEVKTRSSLFANPGIKEIERIINAQPGWRFQLRLVGEPEKIAVAENAPSLGVSGIVQRMSEAQALLDAGFVEAAFLVAWTAAEAVVRALVSAEGIAVDRATDPAYVLGVAVAYGALDRDEYRRLVRLMKYRNAIAHGFEVSDFTGTLVTDLIASVNALLEEYGGPVGSGEVAE